MKIQGRWHRDRTLRSCNSSGKHGGVCGIPVGTTPPAPVLKRMQIYLRIPTLAPVHSATS